MDTLVMKFGGAAVASSENFSHIARLILQRRRTFPRLVIVVSAMGQTTNNLIALAKEVHPSPPQREYDMLISTGERISMSLLAMALCRENCEAISFTGSQSGIMTCSNHSNAHIIDVRPHRISECLDQDKIVIVAGFQGVSMQKEITTLGRGGSDTSAVALAVALGANHAEFYKDVEGIYDKDPKNHSDSIFFNQLNFDQALAIVNQGARVMHARAIELAKKNALPLHIRSFICDYCKNEGTWISDPLQARVSKPIYESFN